VENITTAQGCLLLLVLREHLKEFYGINETKISAYSPSESQKIYERAVTRRTGAKFNPKVPICCC
jgi:cohesin loading factor subunit SCC2